MFRNSSASRTSRMRFPSWTSRNPNDGRWNPRWSTGSARVPSILTPLQAKIVEVLYSHGAGAMGYFLTGGTALSEFYFQHRTSEDLDLFSLESRDLSEDAAFFQDCLS